MAANKLTRPAPRPQLHTGTLVDGDPVKIGRLIADVGAAQQQQAATVAPRVVLTVSLMVGTNRVNHGLGRRARGATVTPTVADATFAWAFATDNATQAIITVVGVPQPNATIEVF